MAEYGGVICTKFSDIEEKLGWSRWDLKKVWNIFNEKFSKMWHNDVDKSLMVAREYNPRYHVISSKEKNRIYKALFMEQHGKCAICGEEPTNRKLSIDHDHGTRRIRGLVCGRCNQAIGLFKDNIFLLQRALDYLIKHV